MASTKAPWKRRAMVAAGMPACMSSRSALKVGAASKSRTDVSWAVDFGVAVFFVMATE